MHVTWRWTKHLVFENGFFYFSSSFLFFLSHEHAHVRLPGLCACKEKEPASLPVSWFICLEFKMHFISLYTPLHLTFQAPTFLSDLQEQLISIFLVILFQHPLILVNDSLRFWSSLIVCTSWSFLSSFFYIRLVSLRSYRCTRNKIYLLNLLFDSIIPHLLVKFISDYGTEISMINGWSG